MANYLFIDSRDPYDSADTQHFFDLVRGVRQRNNAATLFLIQNGVLATRAGAKYCERYQELAHAGVSILADDFSLRERAIDKLAEGVQGAGVDKLVSLLLESGTKAIWH